MRTRLNELVRTLYLAFPEDVDFYSNGLKKRFEVGDFEVIRGPFRVLEVVNAAGKCLIMASKRLNHVGLLPPVVDYVTNDLVALGEMISVFEREMVLIRLAQV